MENNNDTKENSGILYRIHLLPRKILEFYGRENSCVARFVLREICGPSCFNLEKAAYFVDNPDFNRAQGVAGFFKLEDISGKSGGSTSSSGKNASFNEQVRNIIRESCKNNNEPIEKFVQEISKKLEMKSQSHFIIDLKHGNHGILIYQAVDNKQNDLEKLMHEALHLLAFCPIE